MPSTNKKSNNRILLQYAGMAFQLMIALALTVWGGMKLDEWAGFTTPVLIWVLPLLIIIALIVKAIKDTSTRK